MDDEQMTFGSWLQQRRLQLGLTQEALGKQVGLSADMIRKIESESRRPSVEAATLLARWLRLPEAEHTAFVRFARGETSKPPRTGPPVERDEPASSAPWREVARPPGNLRRLLTPLIGREQEIARAEGAAGAARGAAGHADGSGRRGQDEPEPGGWRSGARRVR